MKIRKFALLVSVVAVCLLLLTLQSRGYGASARDLLALVTTPVQSGVARAHRAAFAVWDTYFDWKNARAENRHLRDENQRLRVEALRVGETEDENRRLRRLLALQARLPLTTRAAPTCWTGTTRGGVGSRLPASLTASATEPYNSRRRHGRASPANREES